MCLFEIQWWVFKRTVNLRMRAKSYEKVPEIPAIYFPRIRFDYPESNVETSWYSQE